MPPRWAAVRMAHLRSLTDCMHCRAHLLHYHAQCHMHSACALKRVVCDVPSGRSLCLRFKPWRARCLWQCLWWGSQSSRQVAAQYFLATPAPMQSSKATAPLGSFSALLPRLGPTQRLHCMSGHAVGVLSLQASNPATAYASIAKLSTMNLFRCVASPHSATAEGNPYLSSTAAMPHKSDALGL